MDNSKKYDNPNPRLTANFVSKIIFWWLRQLFWYGRNHDLEVKDLHNVLPKDVSESLGNRLERHWKEELQEATKMSRKPKLFRALKKMFLWSYAFYGIWILIYCTILRVLQPYILGLYIKQFNPDEIRSPEKQYAYATGIVIIAILNIIIVHTANLSQFDIGMRMRVACSSLLYRKILRLSRSSANTTTNGQIINLLSNDVARFDKLFQYLHYIWIMPLQAALIAYLIWESVEIASLAGVFLITVQTIPLQGYLGKLTSRFRLKIAVRTDERVRLMSEIISGIQVIKMYAWEKPFEHLVSLARSHEITVLTYASFLRGFNMATFVFTERTTLFFTIMTYVLLGHTISADKAFSMAQYFNILQCTMAIYYPMAVSSAAEALVSIKRLQAFLMLEERTSNIDCTPMNEGKYGISIKNVNASWTENSIANTLHDINVHVPDGKLYALVGPVGAGKSSFLQLILGELQAMQGQVRVCGSISYASQEPWLFPGTVRSNILFGQPYDKKKYQEVTKACALLKDFEQLAQSDKTLVGDRGASLSGGQCARINLARAVYRSADIYLLDDPLSAVDTHVGKKLFDECINGYLKKKTRILVTHQVQYLKDADMILVLNNGRLESQTSFEEFQKNHINILNEPPPEETEVKTLPVENDPTNMSDISALSKLNINDDEEEDEPQETEELMAKGNMKKSLFWNYFKNGGSAFLLLTFGLSVILAQFAASGADYWVAFWTREEDERKKLQGSESKQDPTMYLWVYAGFIIACVIMVTLRNLLFFKICMNASRNLHNNMFSCLLKVPMWFFDNHPSGRILNRFSKDIGSVDEILPMTMSDSIQIFSVLVGILVQVVIINWWTIFPICIVGILYWQIKTLYLSTAQALKRLEGVTKSPVFSHVNSSLSGLTTIRSCGAQEMIIKEFDAFQDVHTSAFSMTVSTSEAFGFWLDAVSIGFITFVIYSFILVNNENASAGNVGLAVSQVLILCGMLQYGVRQTAETVAQMTSVERILQFTKLEREGPFESDPDKKPPSTWPQKGRVQFDHVYLRYSEDPILKDLHFNIDSGMKVGIVGRTGAGKSSLIAALFNLAKLDGAIYLDEIDTRKIGLHDLRSKISIIPQEPVLFSATLRDNLDPFHKYDDATLWTAMEDVELKNSVTSLDQTVNQGGRNFSAGQRQLLCLARAIVQNNKVLVLDEATANVDPGTDALIQKTIRTKFKDRTVLTIAHRLNTIMDSDKVLVMEGGRAVEFDHPYILLRGKDTYFSKMVFETGKAMTEQLTKVAKEAYESDLQGQAPTDIINNLSAGDGKIQGNGKSGL